MDRLLSPLLIFFLLFTLLMGQSSDEKSIAEDGEEIVPALQNPVLRDHFRDMYPRFQGDRHAPSREFVENFVDLQIERFLREVEENLSELKAAVERIDLWRLQLSSPLVSQATRARIEMLAGLRETEDLADDLADDLSVVFRQLDRKRDLPREVRPGAEEDAYGEEVSFLEEQVAEAERLIRDYLFQTTNLVALEDLGDEDMLVRLHWTEHMSRRIREALR